MNKEDMFFAVAALAALYTFQGMYLFMIIGLWFAWEDAKWAAFDSDNYDEKIMHGQLKPWNKGN